MAFVTLYSYQVSTYIIRTVITDTDNPTYINYYDVSGTGAGSAPSPGVQVGAPYCMTGTYDKYVYRASASSPYATYDLEHNSPYCGYVAPSCDMVERVFTVTDETDTGANDGTVNMFVVSSFAGIIYYLFNADLSVNLSNTTGYFTALAPDTYTVRAQDSNGCSIVETAIVNPFDDTIYTHYKYRLKFSDVNDLVDWEVRMFDKRNNYPNSVYPIDLDGGESPLIITQGNQDEDKTTPIISKNAKIQLWFYGETFTINEFALAPEKQWKIEVYKNAALEFQGWLIPDETQNYYRDEGYIVELTVTDGLPSLKGNIWGDGSGGNGYSTDQIQQYGLASWASLLKQCLDQLGYSYGNTSVVSSLQYNSVYRTNLWLDIGTWSDIFYDSDGNAVTTYDALSLLLTGMHLSIMQWRGRFVLVNWNDLYYIQNSLKTSQYNQAFYEFASDFSNIAATGTDVDQPIVQNIGYGQLNVPINPIQTLNYDKAYNIKTSVNFNVLALLYPNPGLEQGASVGALPLGFSYNGGTFPAGLIDTDSLGGYWSFKVQDMATPTPDVFIENSVSFPSDQVNKQINISFAWKVPEYTDGGSFDLGWVFAYTMTFIDSTSGNTYFIKPTDFKPLSYQDAAGGGSSDLDEIATPEWVLLNSAHFTEGNAFSVKGNPVRDYIGWQDYSFTTPQLPESGVGQLFFRFYPAKLVPYDSSTVPLVISPQGKTHIYFETPSITDGYYLIDNLNLTIGDYTQSTFTKYTGETHQITSVTGVPQANLKEIDSKLFTYEPNKRLAGNVMYGHDYLTAEVQNKWNYALKTGDPADRLAATITRSIARNYQRQLHMFEGDVQTEYLDFYGVFILKYFEDSIFIPYSIEMNCRLATAHVILIEITDDDQQAVYKYTPVFERNARNNS